MDPTVRPDVDVVAVLDAGFNDNLQSSYAVAPDYSRRNVRLFTQGIGTRMMIRFTASEVSLTAPKIGRRRRFMAAPALRVAVVASAIHPVLRSGRQYPHQLSTL
jgi:hypothetical protein